MITARKVTTTAMASCKILVFLLCIVITARALPAKETARAIPNSIQTESDLIEGVYSDCLRKDSMSCLKYKLYNFVDRMLGNRETITVTEGVQIIKTGSETEGAPRALESGDTVEMLIWKRIQRFLESHTIKVELRGSDIVNAVSSTARSLSDAYDSFSDEENAIGIEEGRGKKKKGKNILGPLMAAAALKMAVLGKLALAGIALIAGKALLIGKIALVLSAIIGLKKLLGNQGKHVTYEVVQHPQHSSSHISTHENVYGSSAGGGGYGASDVGGGYGGGSSGHGGWGRSLDAQQLAYSAHVPTAKQQQ